ncbi:Uncharacterised protein [Mycobacteroides abscessus subsp. abscessus]|nr:Uncharacterised protein [Mycobacteroides abscessus subsp. abscessus]
MRLPEKPWDTRNSDRCELGDGRGLQVENRKIPSAISSTVVFMDSVCARAWPGRSQSGGVIVSAQLAHEDGERRDGARVRR